MQTKIVPAKYQNVRRLWKHALIKAWYSKPTFNTNTEGNIIVVECSFTKASIFLHQCLSFKFSVISKGLLRLILL